MWLEMFFFVSTNFILEKIIFACAILDAISVLLRLSLDIKVPKYFYLTHLLDFISLNLFPMIKMFICRHSIFRLITITSVFLLFNFNSFFFLFQQCQIIVARLLYFLLLLQFNQHISFCLFYLEPCFFNYWYPSRFRIII